MLALLNRPWLRGAALLLIVVSWHDVAASAGSEGSDTGVSDGAAITPEFARSLFDQLTALHEADGCRLEQFNTSRFRITVGLVAPSGAQHAFDLSTARPGAGARRAGGWSLAVTPELERDCGSTVAAIAGVLGITAAPRGPIEVTSETTAHVLAGTFLVLLLGTVIILVREARRQRSIYGMLALAVVSAIALALRLVLSPRTFLHEYYHIAETVPAYLTGTMSSLYGMTGPALFRLVGALVGQPESVQVIFFTNAVIASLAIPAVALLDLALMRSWPRALCAAVLLCVLPQHLRFSAAEDLFVQTVTFGLWTLALFALYLRTGRLGDALCSALALALAMQVRPEMLFFPAVVGAMVVLVQPRSLRMLITWRTALALLLVGVLLLPRLIELRAVMQGAPAPPPMIPDVHRYLDHVVLFQRAVTPAIYWVLLTVGALWSAWRQRGLLLWVVLTFAGYTLFSLSLFDNPPYNVRSQILPASMTVLIAAGVAPAWMALWDRQRRSAAVAGVVALALCAIGMVVRSHGFVTELRDQQLEWTFLERTVPQLPDSGGLLSAIEGGGRNLNAFPQFLLTRANKVYAMVDVRQAATGDVPWPAPSDDLLFYQGMFCYFAFHEEPRPDPMTATCRAVHERYVVEPLFIEDLATQGFSHLDYAPGPFRIGFYRLRTAR